MNPFDEAVAKLEPARFLEESKQGQQRRWEHRVVGKILEFYGLVSYSKQMLDAVDAASGFRALTFEAFRRQFPSFPVWLTARKVPWVWETGVQDLVKKFEKTKLFKAFDEAGNDTPEAFQNGRSGLVFEWLHVWPMAIIHDYYHKPRTGCTVIQSYNIKDEQQYAVQSFASFLESVPWSAG